MGGLSLDTSSESSLESHMLDMLQVASLVLLILVLFIYKWLHIARIKTGYKSANTSEMGTVASAAAISLA